MFRLSSGLTKRSRSVLLAIGVAMFACSDANGPDTVNDARLRELGLPVLPEATLFGGSVSDAAQRVVPTVPDERLRWQLRVALANLSNALDELSWTRTERAWALSLSALELCEKIQGLERSEAAELEVIRLALTAIDQVVHPTASGYNADTRR